MFIQIRSEELATSKPKFVVIDCPGFHALPEVDKTRTNVPILVYFKIAHGVDRQSYTVRSAVLSYLVASVVIAVWAVLYRYGQSK